MYLDARYMQFINIDHFSSFFVHSYCGKKPTLKVPGRRPLVLLIRAVQWNLGSRTPLFTNKFSEQNISDDEQCLGLRTRKLATAAS
jgi:hypothetical protein